MDGYPQMTFDDVAERFLGENVGELGDPDKVNVLIGDIIDQIDSRWGVAVKRRLQTKQLSERGFKRVVSNVALRVLRNPDGIYREQLGTYQYQMSQKVASGYVAFLPEEIEALVGGRGVTFGTVDMQVVNMTGRAVL